MTARSPRLGRTVVSAAAIAERLPALARAIETAAGATGAGAGDHASADDLVVVPVMTGAFIFAADLVRLIGARVRIIPVAVSSYPGTATTSQGVRPVGDLPSGLAGRRVLLVDDVYDTGRTLSYLRAEIARQRPAWLATAVLLRKDVPRAVETPCEFVGFDIADEFVVGYGLDYDGCYRNVPDVRVLHVEEGA
jgi:hypoxanthine phosphoribosyltransferase